MRLTRPALLASPTLLTRPALFTRMALPLAIAIAVSLTACGEPQPETPTAPPAPAPVAPKPAPTPPPKPTVTRAPPPKPTVTKAPPPVAKEPPPSVEKPEPKEPAPKEAEPDPTVRRTSDDAEKAFQRLGNALHLPRHSVKDKLSASASADLSSFGIPGALEVTPAWSAKDGLALEWKPSAELAERMPPQQLTMATKVFGGWASEILSPVFESPNVYAQSYHCKHRSEDGLDVVEMTPFVEDAMVEQQAFYFDADGLIERRVFIAKVDPNDPAQAMMAGAEIETTYGYKKVGDRSILTQLSMLTPMGDIMGAYEYYEIEGRAPLLKSITMNTPFSVDPVMVAFHGYEIDGTEIDETMETDNDIPADGDTEDGNEKD